MINIKTIFLDFDGVVVNTVKKITDIYWEDFSSHSDFKEIHWTDINTWEFKELNLATKNQINSYFNQKRFFDNLEFMENAKEFISKLSMCFNIHIVTMGNIQNLMLKEEWVRNNLPCVNNFIGCNLNQRKDKSHIDMTGGIFIDDNSKNLITSNADIKICYGDIFSWNEDWQGIRCYNWSDTYNFLIKLI